jgi:hypothetical protein
MAPYCGSDIMTVSSFIKENRVLVAGLVLPFILIALLAIAKTLPESMVPPPTQGVVYYSTGWSPKGQITPKVSEGGTITAGFNANKGSNQNANNTQPKTTVYIYTPDTNTTETIVITLDSKDQPTSLGKLTTLTLSTQQPSDDGYIFEPYHYQRHALLTDIFSYRSYDRGPVLSKDNRIFKLPKIVHYGSNTEFLGWIKKGQVQ